MRYGTEVDFPFSLFHAQNFWSSPLGAVLLLVASLERGNSGVVSSDIVKVLDLVDSNDPVLASESFVQGVESRAPIGHLDTTYSVLALSRWEECVVVVVGHLVPALL